MTATLPTPAPPEGLTVVRYLVVGTKCKTDYRVRDLGLALSAAVNGDALFAEARSEDRAVAAKYPQFDNSIDGVTDVVARAKWNGETWEGWK